MEIYAMQVSWGAAQLDAVLEEWRERPLEEIAYLYEVASDIRAWFNTPNQKTAEAYLREAIQKYALLALKLSAWLEENLSLGFTFFDFPLEHRKSIRTTNSLEGINREIRRRTRVVCVFPNEASCLRLISALLMEINEEWQIGKHYCVEKII
jgi:putative transposase